MTYRRIRSLSRGVEVLRYLNTVNGAHPVDIGRNLGLPRPTVHRILETLEELELVYQGAYSREFRLTPRVRKLAAGGDQFSRLRGVAWPVMCDLTAELVWPSDLAVFQDNGMLIIESTHRLSSLSSEIGMVGQSRPMLVSPLGRAYLSHSSPEHREMILAKLRSDAQPTDPMLDDPDAIDQMVRAGQRDGYSLCEDQLQKRRASMAVPVRLDGDVVACLNVVWQVSDITFQEARDRFAKPLLTARDRIEARVRDMAGENPVRHRAIGSDVPSCDGYTRRTYTAPYERGGTKALLSAAI